MNERDRLMKIVTLDGVENFDVYLQNFSYCNVKLFAFHNKRDLDIDEQHDIKYGFYQGLIFYDFNKESSEFYYFSDINVFELSESRADSTLFYLRYDENYSEIYLNKLDYLSKENTCFSKFSIPTNISALDVNISKFVGLNNRYVYVSYWTNNDSERYSYVVDSLTGEWFNIAPNTIFNNIDQFYVIKNDLHNFIVLQTGEHTNQERKIIYENQSFDLTDEYLIVIKDEDFVTQAKDGYFNFDPYIIESCKEHASLCSLSIKNSEINYYINDFANLQTSIKTYNMKNKVMNQVTYNELYVNLIHSNNQYYSLTHNNNTSTLCSIDKDEEVVTLHYPDSYAWVESEGVYVYSYLPNGDSRLKLRICHTDEETIIGEGLIFPVLEQDIVIIVKR